MEATWPPLGGTRLTRTLLSPSPHTYSPHAYLFCSFAFFHNLDIALFEGSEGLYAHISRDMRLSGKWFELTYHDEPYINKPPLFFWTLALFTGLFGEHEVALRLPGALFSLGTMMLTYFLGKSLFSRTAGFWAALVVATSHLFLWYGRRVLFDSMQTFFITLALFGWAKAHLQKAGDWWYPVVGVAMAFAVMTKGLHGVALPLVVIVVLLVLARDSSPLKSLSLHLSILLAIAIVATYANLLNDNLRFHFFDIFGGMRVAFNFSSVTDTTATEGKPMYWYLLMMWFDFFPWIALLPSSLLWFMSKPPLRLERSDLFVLIWFLGMFVALSLSTLKREPYLMPLIPPLGLMIGRYCDSVWCSSESKGLATMLLKVMLVLLAIAFVLAMFYGPTLLQKRWETQLSLFPWLFVMIMLSLASLLGYAVIRSKIRLALGMVGVLAVFFSIAVVGFILPAIDNATSARRTSETIRSFPRDPSDTLHLYSPRWPDHEDVVYYLNLEPGLPRLASEDLLLARVREVGQVLAVMDKSSFASLKQKPHLSIEPIHEFRQRRNNNLYLLKLRLTAFGLHESAESSVTGLAPRPARVVWDSTHRMS
jgi:4-amino-4-deoxy-L-arabinose transferase-like glycosyltransferase